MFAPINVDQKIMWKCLHEVIAQALRPLIVFYSMSDFCINLRSNVYGTNIF
jgi:hypothetical protein